ncbi:MAG: LUD domain-containing protein [Segetibacter sp.]
MHKRKEEIGELFHEHLGTEKGLSDPTLLTRVARKHLRNIFISRRAALTGVNFAVAETGEYVVCTNEGNADMGAHLSEVQIASMGLEKIDTSKKAPRYIFKIACKKRNRSAHNHLFQPL